MKQKRHSLILLCIVTLLIAIPVATAVPSTFSIDDETCSYDLGENRHNSPSDCKISATEYLDCLKEKETCPSPEVWNELHYFMGAIILVLLYLRKQKESKSKILNKKKKRNYTGHLPEVGKRTRKQSMLRYRSK